MAEVVIIPQKEYQEMYDEIKKISNLLQNQNSKTIASENLNVNEACAALKVSKRTLFDYKSKGFISYSQIGRKIFFSNKSINEFIERNYVSSFTNPKNKKS